MNVYECNCKDIFMSERWCVPWSVGAFTNAITFYFHMTPKWTLFVLYMTPPFVLFCFLFSIAHIVAPHS